MLELRNFFMIIFSTRHLGKIKGRGVLNLLSSEEGGKLSEGKVDLVKVIIVLDVSASHAFTIVK